MGIGSLAGAWLIYVGIIVVLIAITGLVLGLVFGLRSKREVKEQGVVVDEQFIQDLLKGLGGMVNVETVSLDNGRIKFKVKDLDLVNGEALKALSTSGVFITGNNVKLLFKYDSKVILDELVSRGVAAC